MISKPTGMSPDEETISLTNNTFNLSLQLQSGSAIEMIDNTHCYAALIIWDKDRYYHFFFNDENNKNYAPTVIENDYGIKVQFSLPVNKSIPISGTYKHEFKTTKKTQAYIETKSIDLASLITSGKTYSWKVRLYDKGSIRVNTTAYNPTTKIAYGTISEVHTVYSREAAPYTTTGYNFEIFPHVNIYDNVIDFTDESLSVTDGIGETSIHYPNIVDTVYNIMKNEDPLIHYWLISNGSILPVDKYRLYPYAYDTQPTQSLNFTENFDGYGNPLNGYAIIRDSGISSTDFEGETYDIRTNYIDSDWGYFDIYAEPEITITDNIGNTTENFHTYPLTYSSLNLNIRYSQQQGIGMNYYSYKVYVFDSTQDEYQLVYYSGNRYNQNAVVSYDRFFNNKTYKIVITMVDVKQRVFERTLYFSTVFPEVDSNLTVDTAYYKPHHSIIVDWSNVDSINPTAGTNSSECKYYIVTDHDNGYAYEITEGMDTNYDDTGDDVGIAEDFGKASLYVPSGASLSYSENDFHVPLNFKRTAIIVDFYGTDLTGIGTSSSEIFTFSSSDGFNVSVRYYDSERIFIYTSNYSYGYYLYNSNYATADIAAQLIAETSRPYTAPFVWDDNLTWNDNYIWREINNISGKWRLIITPDKCKLIPLSSYNKVIKESAYYGRNTKTYDHNLTLYGDAIYDSIMIINDCDTDTILNTYGKAPYSNLSRTLETQFFCDFNGHVNGANVVTTLQNLVGYRVYKTLGDSDKLYEVANIADMNSSCILEDFAVGDNCKYTYYIYPIIKTTVENNGKIYSVETISTPMVTEPIIFNEGVDNLFGLREIVNGDRVFEVVPDEVWRLHLNLSDTGYTLNTDKNFYDTLNQYNQETVGNRKYITKSISGLIGYIDCSSRHKYTDTYDMLVSWNDFSSSANMKCLVDARGLILPGNFEANPTVEYMQTPGSPATAKFNWRQKSDLDIIKIYGTLLPFNPTSGTYLNSSEKYYLNTTDKESKILYTTK